jgi:NADP-dependent 3-hydroxy acid dehydrogenase YdfG
MASGWDKIHETSIDAINSMVDTNIKGVLYVTRVVLKKMLASGDGHVINVGSVAGEWVYPNGAVYCATKHAVRAISEGIKCDVHGTSIRVSEIDPGMVHTDFTRVRLGVSEAEADAVYNGLTPLTAHDIAETVVFCATRPKHMNIANITVWPTDQTNCFMVNRRDS